MAVIFAMNNNHIRAQFRQHAPRKGCGTQGFDFYDCNTIKHLGILSRLTLFTFDTVASAQNRIFK